MRQMVHQTLTKRTPGQTMSPGGQTMSPGYVIWWYGTLVWREHLPIGTRIRDLGSFKKHLMRFSNTQVKISRKQLRGWLRKLPWSNGMQKLEITAFLHFLCLVAVMILWPAVLFSNKEIHDNTSLTNTRQNIIKTKFVASVLFFYRSNYSYSPEVAVSHIRIVWEWNLTSLVSINKWTI